MLTGLFMFYCSCAFGQCKYKENKTDEITGEIKKATKEIFVVGDSPAFGLQLQQIGMDKYVVFQLYSQSIQSIDESSKIILRSIDGEKITLENTFETVSINHPAMWRTPFYVKLNDKIRTFLTAKTLDFARFHTNDTYFDRKVKKKGAERINKIMPCI